MFGNPHWFRPKPIGFGLIPTKWQGWAYSAAWGSMIGLPFWLLTSRYQSVEAMLWLAISLSAMAYDVWQILTTLRRAPKSGQACQQQSDQVLYILDSKTPHAHCNCGAAVRR